MPSTCLSISICFPSPHVGHCFYNCRMLDLSQTPQFFPTSHVGNLFVNMKTGVSLWLVSRPFRLLMWRITSSIPSQDTNGSVFACFPTPAMGHQQRVARLWDVIAAFRPIICGNLSANAVCGAEIHMFDPHFPTPCLRQPICNAYHLTVRRVPTIFPIPVTEQRHDNKELQQIKVLHPQCLPSPVMGSTPSAT